MSPSHRHRYAASAGLFGAELELPVRGQSHRVTRRLDLLPGQTVALFDEPGPGAILHWWMTCSHGKRESQQVEMQHELLLRFFYDGAATPAFQVTLGQFFAILFDRDIYPVCNSAFQVLPKNAFNCYWPIPFQQLRIEIENRARVPSAIWFMADWRKYETAANEFTPLRFNVVYRAENPAAAFGSFLMADLTGSGFVAGMVQGVDMKDASDMWYHTGGDLVLLDGETAPHALRGIGGEDVFNMSFGIWPVQTAWAGAPLVASKGEETRVGSGSDGVMYRIFGPDPIWFDSSAVLRFGSRANHLQSLVYAYLALAVSELLISPACWQLAGPFACESWETFQCEEWADRPTDDWPAAHAADFKPYLANPPDFIPLSTEFSVPQLAPSQHGWCDFAAHFRGRQRTNSGTQPSGVSAYAAGETTIAQAGTYEAELAFDDWAILWINGQQVFTARHEHGFLARKTELILPAGRTEIRVKLSNNDNQQWRLWAFNFRLRPVR